MIGKEWARIRIAGSCFGCGIRMGLGTYRDSNGTISLMMLGSIYRISTPLLSLEAFGKSMNIEWYEY